MTFRCTSPAFIASFLFALLSAVTTPNFSQAETPLGWISSDNTSAYTTNKGVFDFSVAHIAVNDAVDVFDFRDELLKDVTRLTGDSGNLSGYKFAVNYGITSELSAFYRHQKQSLTVDLGEISSVDLIDIDSSLETTSQTIGLRWVMYQGNLLDSENRRSALALELSASKNQSSDYNIVLDEIRFTNIIVQFRDPQTFSIAGLDDEGWKARLVYSTPLFDRFIGSVWAGYGESEAKSATTSDITSATVGRIFEQEFTTQEKYLFAGTALNWQLTYRMPLSISYEYLKVTNSSFQRSPVNPSSSLPSFLRGGANTTADNHSLKARIGYWLTPDINVSILGNIYKNQFVGILPHYNNPLTGTFSNTPYGFAGVELGYKL